MVVVDENLYFNTSLQSHLVFNDPTFLNDVVVDNLPFRVIDVVCEILHKFEVQSKGNANMFGNGRTTDCC